MNHSPFCALRGRSTPTAFSASPLRTGAHSSWLAALCALFLAASLRAAAPNWTSTSGPTSSTVNHAAIYSFLATDLDGDITDLEIAWKTPNGGVSSLTGWFSIGGSHSSVGWSHTITFNQGGGAYEIWVNARDSEGNVRDPWLHNIPGERLTVNVSGGNAPPTCTVTASPPSVLVGQPVVVSVAGSDTNGNLRYINVDQVSPTNGFYGPGDVDDESPPNNGWYDLGANYYQRTRHLTLTLNVPGTYVFRGAVNDGSGWRYSATNFTVTVTTGAASPPTTPATYPASNIAENGFTAAFGGSTNATGYLLDVSTSSTFSSYVAGYQNLNVGNVTSHPVTGLSPLTTYYYRVRAYNASGTSASSQPASVTTQAATNPGSGPGLVGQYFDNADFTNLVLTRTDPVVDFGWGGGSPHIAIAPDTFSVRWTGKVRPRYTDAYTFSTISDDGIRLWINGELVIDNWGDHPDTENFSRPIPLDHTQTYELKLQFYENGGGATARLKWQSARQPYETIPASQLFHGDSAGGPQQIYAGSGVITESEPEIFHYYPSGSQPVLTAGTMRVYTTGTTDTKAWIYNYIDGSLDLRESNGGANGNVDVTTTSTPGYYWASISGQEPNIFGEYSIYVDFSSTAGVPEIISPTTATAGYQNDFTGYTIQATHSPTLYYATNLPPGLTLNESSGAITGRPTARGTWSVVVRAANALGSSPQLGVQFVVTPGTQTLNFDPLINRTYGEPPFTLAASTSSGLPVSFSVISGPASLSGNVVTLTGVGAVTIAARAIDDDNYYSVTVTRSFNVSGATSGTQTQTFVGSGAFTVPSGVGAVEVLIVGGGGGGGWHNGDGGGGGGGGGGVFYLPSYSVTSGQTFAITVGAGGSAGFERNNWPTSGGNSAFGSIIAFGGGGGGNWNHDTGWNGGSGGGGTDYANSPGGTGEPGQGSSGGAGARGNFKAAGGGGGFGGAGMPGNASSGQGGAGGAGYSYKGSIYGAGGGGGTDAWSAGGPAGGAGAGNGGSASIAATSAVPGKGGGGGGSGNNNGIGGNGGSGVVIVTYTAASGGQPPTIITQPVNQTVTAGQTALFNATATGTPTLVYKWQKNGADLNDNTIYSGTSTNALSIANATTAEAGNYRVRVTNASGTAYSNSALLTVNSGAGSTIELIIHRP